ncbi:MAG: type III pantothenate kinase [Thiobacillus sp.]|nr:type III pantothenate kinase [Thiobacillus sp.]
MSVRRLLLDAGNTRVKWAVVEADRWLAHGSARYDDLAELGLLLEQGMICHIASVARAGDEASLGTLLSRHAMEPRRLTSTARFGEMVNSYLDPQQLGVDRWMALIAARERTRLPVLVVSVGTAMTVDALSAEGRFLGGVIVPGMMLMRRALQQGTAQLAVGNEDETGEGVMRIFPTATVDAVQSGILAALCGAIQSQYAHLERHARMSPRCFLTGGDAGLVLPHLDFPSELMPGLVLEGIERVTRESEPI